MYFKRLLSVFIAVLLLLSASGCGKKDDANNKKTQKITVKEPTYNSLDEYKKSAEDTAEQQDNNSKKAQKENEQSKPATNPDPNSVSYYANKNTKKFHFESCKSVKKMKQENLYITTSREELINAGYVPCSNCNP